MPRCHVCFRHCEIQEGQRGFCGVRECQNGHILPVNYGRITGLALDPIEKKPFSRFHPGSLILSVGSFGCNLRCPFCQNHSISYSDQAYQEEERAEYLGPVDLIYFAERTLPRGNIGLAFTYNEPLICYEYVRDCAILAREKNLKVALVTNGTASLRVLEELAPYVDAMNIDLKGFTEDYYKNFLGGDLAMVKIFIAGAAKACHVELTTLIIPGENDSEEEMRALSAWVASLRVREGRGGEEIPLHISRFFPCFHLTNKPPTDVGKVYRLAEVARENLRYVYTGNC